MNEKYHVSSSPHTRSRLSTGHVMRDIVIALLPAAAMGIWHFGLQALIVLAASVCSSVLTESSARSPHST